MAPAVVLLSCSAMTPLSLVNHRGVHQGHPDSYAMLCIGRILARCRSRVLLRAYISSALEWTQPGANQAAKVVCREVTPETH